MEHIPQPTTQNKMRLKCSLGLLRTLPSQALTISEDGDCTATLSPCSISLHPHDKGFSPSFTWNFPCCKLCQLPLILLPSEK